MSKEYGNNVTNTMGEGDKGKDITTQHLDNHSAHSNDGTLAAHGDGAMKGGEEMAPMSAEERAGALTIAMEQDPGPDILSWRYMSFVFTAFIAILNSGDNGKSQSWWWWRVRSWARLRWYRHVIRQLDGAIPKLFWFRGSRDRYLARLRECRPDHARLDNH
jgi:hypothetical protein